MKRKFYVFMAVFSGLIFGLSLFYYLKTVQNSSALDLKPLVVAAADIPARTIIQADQLEIREIPVQGYPQGGSSGIEELAGKILLVNVKKGDALLSPMLEDSYKAESAPGILPGSFSFTVPEGKRAMAIPVSQIGSVGYKIKPGDHVDILVTMDIRDEQSGDTVSITSLAAQDVLVLHTGTNPPGDSDKNQTSSSYILAVSVSEAMAVTLGSEKGSLRLLLRNPANKERHTYPPVNPGIYFDPNYFSKFR